MRALIQRARGGSVTVAGKIVGAFEGPGLVVFVGFTEGDGEEQIDYLVRRLAKLAVFEQDQTDGEEGRSPREQSVTEVDGTVLLISQFTLYGSVKKGRKPSWTHAAPGPIAEPLYELTLEKLKRAGVKVAAGKFGAMMEVALVNDGPFTLWVEK